MLHIPTQCNSREFFIAIDPEGVMIRTFIEWFEELKKANPHRLTMHNLEVDVAALRRAGTPNGRSPSQSSAAE
jgi:hypothetical protein